MQGLLTCRWSFERAVGAACNRYEDWQPALRAAAFAAGDWMAASPELMEFGSAGVLRTRNEMVRVRREKVAMFCARLIEQGRESAPDPSEVPEGASLLAVGSILNLLTQKLQEGSEVDLGEMVPEMLHPVVRVHLGEEVAREELKMSANGPCDEEPRSRPGPIEVERLDHQVALTVLIAGAVCFTATVVTSSPPPFDPLR